MMVQLDLWEDDVRKMPWRGISPRELTKSRLALFLRREPQKACAIWIDPDQLELALPVPKAPWVYQGAPLLKEVKSWQSRREEIPPTRTSRGGP